MAFHPKRFFSLGIVIIFLIASFATAPARTESPAATFDWQVSGPFGGTVRSLVQDLKRPARFFLGTADGQIYTSADGARTWKWISGFNRTGLVVDNLVLDPSDPETLYAGVWSRANDRDGGVLKTTDGGKTWKQVFSDHSVRALEMASGDPNLLIVGALDGVFRTTTGGRTWKRITPEGHEELRMVESVAIDPRNTDHIYIGTWHLPWKTTDGGETWVSIKGQTSMILDDSDIFSIRIDQNRPDRVFCSACSGIYGSVDAGTNWTKIQGIPYSSRRTHVLFQNPVRPDTLFACTTEGLWRTTDGGASWKLLTSKFTVINAIAIDPDAPDRVIIGTESSGVLTSEDNGETFRPSSDGFATRQVSSVVADPLNRGRVFASVLYNGQEGGVYVSNDAGRTWQSASEGLGTADVYAVFLPPGTSRTVYAATNTGVFASDANLISWKRIEKPKQPVPPPVTTKPITQKNKGRISQRSKSVPPVKKPVGPPLFDLNGHVMELAATEDGKDGILAASWDGLFRTYSGMKGWEKVPIVGNAGRVLAVATIPQERGTILTGTSEGLFVSRTNGKEWERLEIDERDRTPVQEIAVHPRDPKTVLVGTRRALYVSRDGMHTWERKGSGIPYGDIAAVRFNPRNPDEILVGDVASGGIFLSIDGGAMFRRIDHDALPSRRFWTLAFDPFEDNQVYAGSFSAGVLVGALAGGKLTARP